MVAVTTRTRQRLLTARAWRLSPCTERTLRLWKEGVVKDLRQRPRAGIRKRRQGQAGLPTRFTACCLVAAHRPRVKRHARDVGRAETGRELSARRPDRSEER